MWFSSKPFSAFTSYDNLRRHISGLGHFITCTFISCFFHLVTHYGNSSRFLSIAITHRSLTLCGRVLERNRLEGNDLSLVEVGRFKKESKVFREGPETGDPEELQSEPKSSLLVEPIFYTERPLCSFQAVN
jgi:hypothetical protein